MTEHDTFVTVADGDQLNDGYFNGIRTEVTELNDGTTEIPTVLKHMGSDQTAETISSSSSETVLGEVTITASKVTNAVLIYATGSYESKNDEEESITIRLRAGTNARGGSWESNSVIKTIVREVKNTSSHVSGVRGGWAIVFRLTGLTWASTNYVQISGQNSDTAAQTESGCESIEVYYE